MEKVKPIRNEESLIRIILVDDDQVLLDTMKILLERLGYIVNTATGGNEAIALMKSFVFDLVITDYDMPGMNGLQLALNARKVLGDTPVILFTGSIHLTDEQQMVGAGIAEILRKPCNTKDLDFTIKKVVTEKRRE